MLVLAGVVVSAAASSPAPAFTPIAPGVHLLRGAFVPGTQPEPATSAPTTQVTADRPTGSAGASPRGDGRIPRE